MNKTGRSHAGCLTCKARKVKCDEEKPSCRRCIRLKRECPGYKDTWDTVHRRENEHVAQLVQVRVNRKLRERRDQEMTTAGGSSSSAGRLVLPRPVLVDAADCTLNHFYRDYSLNSGVAFFGILPSVSTSMPVPCFFDAIHAVAFASSSRQLSQSDLMARARRHYGRAVVGLNQAIQAPESVKSDSVLVALYLMGLFEAIIAQPSLSRPIDTESSCHPHSRGGIMLLEYRSRLGISGDLDRMVMASFSYIAVMEYFVSPPGFAPLWTQVTNFKSSWAEGPCLEPLVARAVHLKAAVEDAIQGVGPHQGFTAEPVLAKSLMESGLTLVDELKSAADLYFTPRSASAFNSLIDTSTRATATFARCLYLAVRQHVIELLMSLVITLGEPAVAGDELALLTRQGAANIEAICDHICAVFGFDGREVLDLEGGPGNPHRIWCMIWPMTAVLSSCLAEESTKGWVLDKFYRVGKATGFGVAMLTP